MSSSVRPAELRLPAHPVCQRHSARDPPFCIRGAHGVAQTLNAISGDLCAATRMTGIG
jgi:hypothetical protein